MKNQRSPKIADDELFLVIGIEQWRPLATLPARNAELVVLDICLFSRIRIAGHNLRRQRQIALRLRRWCLNVCRTLDGRDVTGEHAALLDFDIAVSGGAFDAARLAQREANLCFNMFEDLALNIGLIDAHLALDGAGRPNEQIARDDFAVDCPVNNHLLRCIDRTFENHAFAEICATGLTSFAGLLWIEIAHYALQQLLQFVNSN